MTARTSKDQRKPRRSCRDQIDLLGCSVLCSAAVAAIGLGYYRHYSFWLAFGILVVVGTIWLRLHFQQGTLRQRRALAIWEEVSRQVFSLSIETAEEGFYSFTSESSLFSLTPITEPAIDIVGYPSTVQKLFGRFATIQMDDIAVGRVLPPLPFGDDAFEYFAVPAPYHLIGYDLFSDQDGTPLVVKGGEDAIYALNTSDEPGEVFISPSIYHLLLARAELVRRMDSNRHR